MKEAQVVGSRDELEAQGVVEVVVPDLRAALAFYRDVGFTVERETSSFVTVKYEGTFLFIAENVNASAAPRWTNVRIIVTNVDAVWRRIQLRGLPVGTPIGDRPYGLRDFTVRDPGGFEIRFAQPLAV